MTKAIFFVAQIATAVALGLGAFGIGCGVAFAAGPVKSGHGHAVATEKNGPADLPPMICTHCLT